MSNTETHSPETPEVFKLTDEKFQEYVRSHNKFTVEHLSGESETPALLVVTRNYDLEDELCFCSLMVPFNEHDEKHKALFGVGKKFFAEQKVVLAVILSSECWMSQHPVDGDWKNVQPRHDPLKREGILVAGVGIDPKQKIVIMTPIRRGQNNNIEVDGESKEMLEEGSRFPLLSSFWRGYFSTMMKPS